MKRFLVRHAAWISTPILAFALVAVWDAYVETFGISPMILPTPLQVARGVFQLMSDPRTLGHAWVTLYETLSGFGIAVIVGVGLGVMLGKVQWLERSINPFIIALQVMPKVALVPIFIVWFGFGSGSKIVMAAVLAFFPIMTNTILGIKSVGRGHKDVMISLNASRFATFWEMELPATLPYVLTGAEVGIVLAVIGAIVGEYLGGNRGLGYLAVATLNAFDVQAMFAVIFILTVVGFVLYFAVVALRRRLTPWHEAVAAQKDN